MRTCLLNAVCFSPWAFFQKWSMGSVAIMKRLMIILILILSVLQNEAHATFMGIGDLPGGIVESMALGVSADGMTVVGSSRPAGGSRIGVVVRGFFCGGVGLC